MNVAYRDQHGRNVSFVFFCLCQGLISGPLDDRTVTWRPGVKKNCNILRETKYLMNTLQLPENQARLHHSTEVLSGPNYQDESRSWQVLLTLLHLGKGCSLNIVFFPRILESLPLLPRQHMVAIGCTKNYQPIGVTVHSHCVESFEGLLHSDVDKGGVVENCAKTQFFMNTLYV